MFRKFYLSRAQTRAMSNDHPIGDPMGGAAYREMRDPVTAGISAVATIGSSLISSNAAKSAGQTQSDAATAAALAQAQASKEAGQIQANAALAASQAQSGAAITASQTQADAARAAALLQQQTVQAQTPVLQGIYGNNYNYLNNLYNAQYGAQSNIYGANTAALAPYLALGASGVNQLSDLTNQGYFSKQFGPQDLYSNLSPNYDFMKQQGLGAVNQQMNVAGGGSNITRSATKFAEDYASNAYQQAFNNFQTQRSGIYNTLSGIAGFGQTANAQNIAAGSQYSNALGNLYNPLVSAQTSSAQNLGQGLTNLATGGAAAGAAGLTGSAQAIAAGLTGSAQANAAGLTGAAQANAAGLTGAAQAGATGLTGAAQAGASGQVGSSNALAGGISGLGQTYALSQLLAPKTAAATGTLPSIDYGLIAP
jgi:hypothetical protein